MSREKSILVCGIGEAASATARRLFAEDYAVALYRATPPRLLRRRMSFVDAWFDAYASLDGVEARRADVGSEFLLGFQTREFIPLLRHRFSDIVELWPWDVIVVAQEDEEPTPVSLRNLAELTIGLGEGFVAGVDCDLAIETEWPDPGRILREGDLSHRRRTPSLSDAQQHCKVFAADAGLFRAHASIGTTIEAGEKLGFVGDAPVLAPVGGRIKGIARKEQAVVKGAPLVEIALSPTARVAGICEKNQLISRGVAFAVEMEAEGWKPFSFENWA